MQKPQIGQARRGWLSRIGPLRLLGAGITLAYWVFFVWQGLSGQFSADDMMNIYYYWDSGGGQLIRGLFLFFTTFQRPMGGVFYWLLYHSFGLNPFPYHLVITCLLLVNTYLAYRFAVLISGSELIAGFCALVTAYHVEMAHLVFFPSFIFDVLCFTFYFLTLNYYLSIRASGKLLSTRQTVLFLLLYVGALDSKEMAVTLPVMVVLYEAIWRRPESWSLRGVMKWSRNNGRSALLAGLLAGIFILGKAYGADSLMRLDAYRPVFTWSRYLESTARCVNTFLSQPTEHGFFASGGVLPLWAILLCVAWLKKDKHLLWTWFFILVAPLPMTFLPGRGGANLYIPLVGWAIFAATLFVGLCNVIADRIRWRRVPAAATRGTLVLLAVAAIWLGTARRNLVIVPAMKSAGNLTWSVIQQLRAVQPRVKPGSRIYFVNDVFRGWDTQFIAELTYGDHSVHVWLQQHTPLGPADLERMDYIFTFEQGRLKRLKPAQSR